jgi:hypothetical protein
VFVVNNFYDSLRSSRVEANLSWFSSFVYILCIDVGRPRYQEGRVGFPFLCRSQARTGISNVICYVIGKFDIFPSMCGSDKVLITELTLIHKNIRSFRNSHVQELTDIENIGQCDLKHILTLLIKTITSVLKISAYIITACPVGLAAILAIMSAVILYVLFCSVS